MSTTPHMGEVFAGRYRLEKRVAEVPAYSAIAAHDEEEDRLVELWLVREELVPGAGQRELVMRNAALTSELENIHLRAIYDAGVVQSQVYVAVEHASLGGIRRRLETGRPSPDSDIVLYATSITSGLEAAHADGYVHGRLIPEDIVTVSGLVKIGGVGLWADLDLAASRRLWRPADRYLAPEVRETGLLSKAADVYSMAALLVELASGAGEVPIHQATQALLAEQPRLADILTPALSPSPRHRPGSPAELLRRIRQVLIDDKVPTNRREAVRPPSELFGRSSSSTGMPFRGGPGPRSVGKVPVVEGRRRQPEIKETLVGFDGDLEKLEPKGKRGASEARQTLAGYPAPKLSGRHEVPDRPTEPMEAMSFEDAADYTNVEDAPKKQTSLTDELRAAVDPTGKAKTVSKKRQTDKLPYDPPLPGPREDAAGKKRPTDRLDGVSPSPGPNRTSDLDAEIPEFFKRSTAEAPAEYPEETLAVERAERATAPRHAVGGSQAAGARRSRALPTRPPGASPRRARNTSNPLAEPMGIGRGRRSSAPLPVQMLEGTASAPPRFATASPLPAGDDTDPNLTPAPADDEDPDSSMRFALREEVSATAGEQTLSGKRRVGAEADDPSTLDREWTYDDSIDEDGEEVEHTLDESSGRNPTADDTHDRETLDQNDEDGDGVFDSEPSEQERTNVRRRRKRPLTSENQALLNVLPLRPKDTGEPFDAVNLADLEKQLSSELEAETETGRGPPGPPPRGRRSLEFVSARDESAEVTRRRSERPKKRAAPKLRSLADEAERPRRDTEKDLGRYAPSRDSGGTTAQRRIPWGTVLIGVLVAGGICAGTWWGLTQWSASNGGTTEAAAPIDAAAVVATAPDASPPAPPAQTCPTGMVAVAGRKGAHEPFCIDIYEHPGQGEKPVVDVSYADAVAICEERGGRLCKPTEWVAACRGPGRATYPYGVAFASDKCNVDRGSPRDIVATGSFAECVSAAGVFDASGNVAEWVEGRYSYGGSARDRSPGRCPERKAWPNPKHKQADIGFRCCAAASR